MRKVIIYSFLATAILSFVSCAKGISSVTTDYVDNCVPCGISSAGYTPTETSLNIKNETQKMLYSPIDKFAGAETDEFSYYFVMNENQTFSVIVNMHDTKQYDFRAGTFKSKGDTLNLNYYRNLKSAYITDKVVLDNDKKEMCFLSTDKVVLDNDKKEMCFLSTDKVEAKRLKIKKHIPSQLIAMLFKKAPDFPNVTANVLSAKEATAMCFPEKW